jgi:O-antigen/teichoic acid export membrane protein
MRPVIVFRRIAKRFAASPSSRNAIWALAGASTARAGSFLTVVVLARILGGVGYGELSAVQTTALMFGSFASFGLGLTATKFVAEFAASDRIRAGRVVALSTLASGGVGVIVSGVLFVLGPWLARSALDAPRLGSVIRLGALLVFLGTINGAQAGTLAGLNAFRPMSKVITIAAAVSVVTTVAGATAAGIEGALWGMALGLAVNGILSMRTVRREAARLGIGLVFRGCQREWRLLTSFSLPTAIAEVMVGPVSWACAAVLVNQRGGYAEFGVYSAVMRVKLLPEFLLGSLTLPVLPALTARLGSGDETGYRRTLSVAHALSFGVMIPFAVLLALVPNLGLLPFGRAFLGHEAVVRWLMLQAVLVGLFQPMGSVLASTNRMWLSLGYNLSWAMAFVGLSVLLVPRWLGAGLAAAFALSHLVTSVPTYAIIRRLSGPLVAGSGIGRLAFAALAIFGVGAGAPMVLGARVSWALGGAALLASVVLGASLARRALGGFLVGSGEVGAEPG